MTHSKRAWSMAAIVAGFLVLVALALSDDGTPEVRQSRGLMQPRAVGDDVAFGKSCAASAQQASCSLALDNDDATRWAEGTTNSGQWISVDLGSSIYISSTYVVQPFIAYSCTYNIQTSTDNSNWSNLVTGVNGYGHITTPLNASSRYWRLLCTTTPSQTNRVYTWRLIEGSAATNTPTNTATFTPTNTPTITPTPTNTPTNTATFTPTNTPTITPTPTNTPTPSPTPTATNTPAATWTPEPTSTPANTFTPGPTPTPRPTIANQTNADIHVYDIDTFTSYSGNCTALVAAGAPETWSISGSAVYEDVGINNSRLIVCNVGNIPKQCDLSSTWLTTGYSEAFSGVVGCYPTGNACTSPSNYRELFGGARTQPCTIGGNPVGGEHSGTYNERWWVYPFGVLSQNYSDRLEILAMGGGLSFGSCSSAGSAIAVAVDCGPTPTPRPTRTPSPTPSPTHTRTPVATRPTATSTLTPTAWPGITCPTAVVTVDASLADWTAIPATPMPLSAADAAYIWPAATPSVADLSGLFKCAHSADTLFLSGVITDSVLYQDSAPIDDDAAQIAVDGWGDGFLRYRADDHELSITQDGRLRDLATLPITATVATTLTVAGWQFEIGIPKSVLELPTLTQRLIGLVFGLIDDDDGGQLDQQIIAPTRTVLLQ